MNPRWKKLVGGSSGERGTGWELLRMKPTERWTLEKGVKFVVKRRSVYGFKRVAVEGRNSSPNRQTPSAEPKSPEFPAVPPAQ